MVTLAPKGIYLIAQNSSSLLTHRLMIINTNKQRISLTLHINKGLFNMDIKKTLLLAITTAIATPAFSGFYVGAQVGGALTRGDVAFSDNNASQTTIHTRSMGAAYGAQLGYMHHFKDSKMILLAEGGYLKESSKSKQYNLTIPSSTTPGTLQIEATNSYGAALGVGIFVNPKVGLYAKVGFENKGIKTTYTLPNQTGTFSGKKKTAWSVVPGFGFIYKATHSIGIGAEYNYLIGKKYNILPQTTNTNSSFIKSINFTPTEHRMLIKLNYMFGA